MHLGILNDFIICMQWHMSIAQLQYAHACLHEHALDINNVHSIYTKLVSTWIDDRSGDAFLYG